MNIVSVVGTRPQFVKLGPVSRCIREHNASGGPAISNCIVHTGQHYDPEMSDVFFQELDIPKADIDLGVGSGTHGSQTARMLERIESALLERPPDIVVVYGDTNSTLAGALAASKLNIPVAHVEAGLRSQDRTMPEEINRVAVDHLADLLLAPTRAGMVNLWRENLAERTVLSGDVMYDSLLHYRGRSRQESSLLRRLRLEPRAYAVATLHRAENVDSERLGGLLDALNRVAATQLPIVFPVHPRTRGRISRRFAGFHAHRQLKLIEPVSYLQMLALVENSALVLTDSGGLQKEALFCDSPCVTLRDRTEWNETVQAGANILAGADAESVVEAASTWARRTRHQAPDFSAQARSHFGDGKAAQRIVQALLNFHLHRPDRRTNHNDYCRSDRDRRLGTEPGAKLSRDSRS